MNKSTNLRAWVKMGAPDPRTGDASAPADSGLGGGPEHWAFQPVTEPPVPKITGTRAGSKLRSTLSSWKT